MSIPVNGVFQGLGTYTMNALAAGPYIIQGYLYLPRIVNGSADNSSVVVTVKKNADVIYTGVAGALGFEVPANLVAGDVVSVIAASAAAVDQPANAVKCVCVMG